MSRLLSVFLALAIVARPVFGKETEEPETSIVSPSPDGRFAFVESFSLEQRTLDLINKSNGKVLLRVAQSDEGGNRLTTSVFWSPDSKRFALMRSTHRLSSDVAVYLRAGNTFREVKLPDLPLAKLPQKLTKDEEHFWHWAAIDWTMPVRWQKDGSLVVEIETTMDGNANTATATRTVVLQIDAKGQAKILSSTQRISTHIE
jgi:hypothetical protein